MLLNSNRSTEYDARADEGFARGSATEAFWQAGPVAGVGSHLARGAGAVVASKPPLPPRRPQAPWVWAEEVRAAAAADRAAPAATDDVEDDAVPLRRLQAKLVALTRLRDAAGPADAAQLEAEAADAARAVDAHRRSVGRAWPVAPRYLRRGGVESTDEIDGAPEPLEIPPPPPQQTLENATRWPVDAVLARLRAHLGAGRRDARFGLKEMTQTLRKTVSSLRPPVAASVGPRELGRLFAALGLAVSDAQGQLILDRCAAPTGLAVTSLGTLARTASQSEAAPSPTREANASLRRRGLVETPPAPPPPPPPEPTEEEAALGSIAGFVNDDAGAHPATNRFQHPEPFNQSHPRAPTAGHNARRARQPVTMRDQLADVELAQNADHYRRNIAANKRVGHNIIF